MQRENLDSTAHGNLDLKLGPSPESSVLCSERECKRDEMSLGCFIQSLLQMSAQARESSEQPSEAQQIRSSMVDLKCSDLSEKQLMEFVWRLRSLAKRMRSIVIKPELKNILVITKSQDPELVQKTRKLVSWLLTADTGVCHTVYVENKLFGHEIFDPSNLQEEVPSAKDRLKFWDRGPYQGDKETSDIDFIVTLGGDGTVLETSRTFQRVMPPVLSFSLGSLGFLTTFNFDDYQMIFSSAFSDGIIVNLRLRFECKIMRSKPLSLRPEKFAYKRSLVQELVGEQSVMNTHVADQVQHIFNDIVVDRGPNPTMSATEVFGDGEYFTSVLADGVCVATPTGSTAYNLSAGGSLCHPDNPVVLLTAICPHTLNFRPIILPDSVTLQIGVEYDARYSSWASFDGRDRVEIKPGDYVSICASKYPFIGVLPSTDRSREWIASISRTFNWNARKKQLSFDRKAGT